MKGFNDFKTRFPELAAEWSDQNLPLLPEDINEKSRLNVWWKCGECGYEWQSVVYTRVHGSSCPVCAARKVSVGINDLTTTDPDIAGEWDYEKNKCGPERYSRYSMEHIWWKGSCGHSWNMRISERTLEQKGCSVCEAEFVSVLHQLAALYYAGRKGFKAKLNDETLIGLPLDVLIPSAGIAIEAKELCGFRKKTEECSVRRLLCKKHGIALYTIADKELLDDPYIIYRGSSLTDLLEAVLTAFRRSNIYINAEPEKDVGLIRKNYFRWRQSR